jgi:hypothetical protein
MEVSMMKYIRVDYTVKPDVDLDDAIWRNGMTVLRFLVLGALLLTVGRSKVISAQMSSPYAQALDRAKEANELRVQRQRQLIAESDKLVELSADLKKRIDNSPPDRLSVDSLKEAAEIEKLAHKLHQQMKD